MIIARIQAGLGNQMFQYACGRALALRNHDILKLDTTSYGSQGTGPYARKFDLDRFNVSYDGLASPEEIDNVRYRYGFASRQWEKVQIKLGMNHVAFEPRIVRKKGDVYLNGYWQSERYFLDQADAIRNDFSLEKELGHAARSMLQEIGSDDSSVSLQVRLGDNAHDPQSMETFGTLPDLYYEEAVKYISADAAIRRAGRPIRLYIFSDEIDKVRKDMAFGHPTEFVTGPEIRLWEELPLMSACHYHIISNSTFGWWGAWLDPRPDKIVVAPKRWTRVGNRQFRDLVPPDWVRL